MLKKYQYYAQDMCLLHVCSRNKCTIMLKKCAYYAQEILLYAKELCILCLRNVCTCITFKEQAYYTQEMSLLCSRNMNNMLKKCAYHAQEMHLL